MKFHQILKSRRKELGLTQQDIADLWGIKSVNVSDWENDRGMPETARIPALAKRLKLTISELFGETAYRVIEKDTTHSETRSVIQMMEETDAEGRILAKHAVTDALKKYRGNQETSRPGAIPSDIYEAMAGESDEVMYEAVRAALDSVGKLHKLKKQM